MYYNSSSEWPWEYVIPPSPPKAPEADLSTSCSLHFNPNPTSRTGYNTVCSLFEFGVFLLLDWLTNQSSRIPSAPPFTHREAEICSSRIWKLRLTIPFPTMQLLDTVLFYNQETLFFCEEGKTKTVIAIIWSYSALAIFQIWLSFFFFNSLE